MEFITVTEQQLEQFRGLLPARPLLPRQTIFGCLHQGEACCCGVVDRWSGVRSLSWLFVPEALRGRGFATFLLDRLCALCAAPVLTPLELCYPTDHPLAWQLDAMAAHRGGRLHMDSLPCFQLTGEELRNTPLMRGAEPSRGRFTSILPLNSVTALQLRELKLRCESEGLYTVSRADFVSADPLRSMVCLQEDQIRGLALVEPGEEERELELSLFYLDPRCSGLGLALLRSAAQAALDHPEGLTRLRFLCVSPSSLQLAQRLLGQDHQTERYLTTAVLSPLLHRPGATAR